jgi:hypothetical protein
LSISYSSLSSSLCSRGGIGGTSSGGSEPTIVKLLLYVVLATVSGGEAARGEAGGG